MRRVSVSLVAILLTLGMAGACGVRSELEHGLTGPEACVAAGGQCVLGTVTGCAQFGPQDCNPDRNPGGGVCCLQPMCTSGSSHVIQSSSYDQTCTMDADCVSVAVGDMCGPCFGCQRGGINQRDQARYGQDVRFATDPSDCLCPATFNPCCLDRMCRTDMACAGRR